MCATAFGMLITASDAHRAHHPRTPFLDRGLPIDPPEIPERVDRILAAVSDAGLGAPRAPSAFGPSPITRVHTPEYLEFLEHAHTRWRAATGLDESSDAAGYARAIRDQPHIDPEHIIAQL